MKDEKIDKGFCLAYRKLSWRRKFLRNLWITPVSLAAIAVFFYLRIPYTIILMFLLVVALSVELSYTFFRWRKELTGQKTQNTEIDP